MKLNGNNKYRVNRLSLSVRKNILSGRYFIRNTVAALIFASVIGTPVIIFNNRIGDKSNSTVEASEINYSIELSDADLVNEDSIEIVKRRIAEESQLSLSAKKNDVLSGAEFDMTGKFITTVASLNIRETASEDAELVGRLFEGASGKVEGTEGEWTKITSGSVTGYVKTEFIIKDKEAAKVAKNYKIKLAKVNETTVRVREYGTTDADVLYMAKQGETFPIYEDLNAAEWTSVRISDSTYGFISNEFVNVIEGFAEAIPASRLKEIEETMEANEKAKEEKEKEAIDAAAETEESSEDSDSNYESPSSSSSSSSESSSSESSGSSSSSNETKPDLRTEESVNVGTSDLYLLAAIVYAESGGEPYEGQLAVANVVLNRLRSGYYGSTLSDVIYAPYQFSATDTSAFRNALTTGGSSTSLAAAEAALAGTNNIGSYKNFRPTWFYDDYDSLGSYTIIQNHIFF